MQVFIPYPEPIDCAKALWNDKKRFNKQIIECRQILEAMSGNKRWSNHLVTKMYKKDRMWLYDYLSCFINYRESKTALSKKDELLFSEKALYDNSIANEDRPDFITEELCDQNKRRLYTKSPELYPQFASYGTSEENWYVIDGEIVKYINGKKL